jgi:hypothetical protein
MAIGDIEMKAIRIGFDTPDISCEVNQVGGPQRG